MEITTENYTFRMMQDGDAQSPREWDNLATMVFFGKKAHLGDEHDYTFYTIEEMMAKHKDIVTIKPVYGYIHSGMTISTKPFNCRWDSGQLGYVIVTKESIRENYGKKRLSAKFLLEVGANIEKIMESEVEILDQWIRGDVYGFEIGDMDGNHVEGCWGFYGHNPIDNGVLDHIFTQEVRDVIEEQFSEKA